MSDVLIRVNTYNRLKKIRSGVVYGTIETVIDELLQNCHRTFKISKTVEPSIDVVIGEDYFIIRDNGGGCKDPQDIFEFETSGWDIHSAFGQGGSESVFQIADKFTIRSLDWIVNVDVNNVIETENLSLNVEKETFFNGYEITIQGKCIYDNISLIQSYLESVLQSYPYDCYINGVIIDYTPLQTVSSKFTQTFDNKFYTATLGIQHGWKDSQIFYENRLVTDKWLTGVIGVIELKSDSVDLKAPDRKSIISNNKYREFCKQLEEDSKELYLYFVSQASEEDFEEYVDHIDNYLDAIDYLEFLPDYNCSADYIRMKELSEEIPNEELKEYVGDVIESIDHQSNGVYHGSGGGYMSDSVKVEESKLAPPIKKEIKKFKDKLLGKVNTVWVEMSKRESYLEVIETVESYGVKVLTSKNKLYDKAYEFLKIPHIDEIAKRTESQYIISSNGYVTGDFEYTLPERSLLKKETRIMDILHKIEDHYELNNVFRIADVKEHILIQDNEKVMVDTTAKTSYASVKDNSKIFLDRESLQLSKIKLDTSKASVTKFDVLVVLMNVNTIASGLSSMIYHTVPGTVAHYNKIEKISKEIALLLASL